MARNEIDSANLPFLPVEWLKAARGIAVHSLGYESVAAVPPEHRPHVLGRVGESMRGKDVVPPPGWEAALAKQCGWDPTDEEASDLADAKLAERGEVFSREDDA